jgi:peptide/nickel transport system ATP-binding protein
MPALTPVIAGLDPAIHPTSQDDLISKKMDPRVKPAGDV